jgi:hypothetical protein
MFLCAALALGFTVKPRLCSGITAISERATADDHHR